MNEVMTLEEYKKQVEKCLNENYRTSKEVVNYLMEHYEESFPEFMEMKLTPAEATVGMVMNLL